MEAYPGNIQNPVDRVHMGKRCYHILCISIFVKYSKPKLRRALHWTLDYVLFCASMASLPCSLLQALIGSATENS